MRLSPSMIPESMSLRKSGDKAMDPLKHAGKKTNTKPSHVQNPNRFAKVELFQNSVPTTSITSTDCYHQQY